MNKNKLSPTEAIYLLSLLKRPQVSEKRITNRPIPLAALREAQRPEYYGERNDFAESEDENGE
jgi:hypothetical protein